MDTRLFSAVLLLALAGSQARATETSSAAKPYLEQGAALAKAGKLDEAIAQYRKALDADPKSDAASQGLAGALVAKAKALTDEAYGIVRASADKHPEVSSKEGAAHDTMGVLLEDAGFKGEGRAEYQKAVEADPKFAWGYMRLGDKLRGDGKLDEALVLYRKSVEVDPKFGWGWARMSDVLGMKGDRKAADEAGRKYLEVDPHGPASESIRLTLEQKK